jgi:hypothetical protein
MKFADALRDRDACLPRFAELLGPAEAAVENFLSAPPAEEIEPPGNGNAHPPCLGEEAVRVRIYRPTGLPEVVIPERYDVALDEIRRLRAEGWRFGGELAWKEAERARERLSAHPLGDALLPEELLPVLAHLPTPVRRVVVWDRPNPQDLLEQHTSRAPGFSAPAMISPAGVITLFQRKRSCLDYTASSGLRDLLFRLWAHLLRWESPRWWGWFEQAARIEPVPAFLQAAQMSGVEIGDLPENWAVHLANLLSLHEPDGQLTLEQVPLRTAVLARALAAVLDALPEGQRGKYHSNHAERAARLAQLASPGAQDALLGHIRNLRSPDRVGAGRLLLEMEWDHRLRDLKRVTDIDLSRSAANDQTLEHLRPLRRLESLALQGTRITDAAGAVLRSLKTLRILDVSFTEVTSGLLGDLQGLSSLKYLDVRGTMIRGRELEEWKGLRPDVEVVV